MKAADLRRLLADVPDWMEVRVLLEYDWFPDDVNLNDVPGWYRIERAGIKGESDGQMFVIHLDEEQRPVRWPVRRKK